MLIPLDWENLKNGILEIIAIIRVGGDKLLKALIAAVFCVGILDPSAPNATVCATGGADIMFSGFGVCNKIDTGNGGQLIFPFFVGSLVIDNLAESFIGQ